MNKIVNKHEQSVRSLHITGFSRLGYYLAFLHVAKLTLLDLVTWLDYVLTDMAIVWWLGGAWRVRCFGVAWLISLLTMFTLLAMFSLCALFT